MSSKSADERVAAHTEGTGCSLHRIVRLYSLAAAIALLFTAIVSLQSVHATTLSVTNTLDDSSGSLRNALVLAKWRYDQHNSQGHYYAYQRRTGCR
jgi:hypothetical protein